VQFSDGTRLESYRVDRGVVEAAMAGDTVRAAEVRDLLARHLTADFLGRETDRPPRTTELAREAGAKPAAAAPAPSAAPVSPVPAAAPAAPARPSVPAAPQSPVPAAAPANEAEMSREERIAAARARAEALRAQRQNKP
jgi:hypothetical protein